MTDCGQQRQGERERESKERGGEAAKTDADCGQLPLSLCKTWLIECRMPPDKGHGTSQAQPTHPTPDPAPSPIPSRQLLSHLTSALWPRKNIIIIKMKMKQREWERKREQKETARNKIKEMLFHNANCAASITPPSHCTPLPTPFRPRLWY